jgi:hypothetical protein
MQLSLRTLVSRAFDAADWVIIREVAPNKFWVSERQWAWVSNIGPNLPKARDFELKITDGE